MDNLLEYYIVSKDGTIIEAASCVASRFTKNEIHALEERSDDERYSIASSQKGAINIDSLIYDIFVLGDESHQKHIL